ncbi:MAG: hypothetical protein AAFR12_16850 [Cyanobacteria bacterium J06626_6]
MRLTCYRTALSLLLLAALASCQPPIQQTTSPEDTATSSEDSTAPSDTNNSSEEAISPSPDANDSTKKSPEKPTSQPIFPALDPGKYCYATSTETETIHVRFTVDPSDRVIGNAQGTIHNDAESYYTSYRQNLDGTIDGSNLNLDIATWIEYDRQNQQETWKVSDKELILTGDTLTKESCKIVDKTFQNENGIEASDLTSSANRVKTEQVFFDPGKSSTTLSNAVVRGDRDLYILTAQGGQLMTLAISSIEDNAVFDIVDPSGLILGTELTQEKIRLPHTGDVQIIVGGTRGNATYDLEVAIE